MAMDWKSNEETGIIKDLELKNQNTNAVKIKAKKEKNDAQI
jgi:hypothetical protein